MNIKMKTENSEAAVRDATEALSASAIARRRILLKGVGKGTAVLAATVPLQTLAGQSLLTIDKGTGIHQCTVSGMHSGVHSATPTNTPVCSGFSPGWWGQTDNGTTPRRAWPILPIPNQLTGYLTKFNSVFTWMVLPGDPNLFQVANPPGYSSTHQWHWLCAWLNALWSNQHPGTLNFPYSADEVIAYSKLTGAPYSDALTFFSTYVENL